MTAPEETAEFDDESAASESDFAPAVFAEEPAVEAPAAAGDEETAEVDPNASWWTEPEAVGEDDDETEVEEDTEAFLEKVFSGLDSNEDQPQQEEGYGLLRRRRLGSR